ncbi:YdeI/OmpD-associated family protein [Zhouia spongiae]|uniref:YdeI/OmpD-associated family protein n=1 Tax=Zhouia spongiae TaxID=2202721 RepID=A0ABY3YHK5_9FLAO|nr:YdeI/OmpD-associated family protein [Zhouia spongiae]UNY97396.1 YdeI/OmpD-associated family protein [Zhouia spongiae]
MNRQQEPQPIVRDKKYLLEKFEGKGSWTYALIPEIPQNPKRPFGWVIVSGYIDHYPLKKVKLMPKGNGLLFLAVKAAIRKVIKKEAGDYVNITLYEDCSPLYIPDEILDCFHNEPKKAYNTFIQLEETKRKVYLDWIYSAKTEDTKAQRIIAMMDRLCKGLSFYDKENPLL